MSYRAVSFSLLENEVARHPCRLPSVIVKDGVGLSLRNFNFRLSLCSQACACVHSVATVHLSSNSNSSLAMGYSSAIGASGCRQSSVFSRFHFLSSYSFENGPGRIAGDDDGDLRVVPKSFFIETPSSRPFLQVTMPFVGLLETLI